jgi:RNA polymerase sigma factor (sigma-70 family)
MNSNDIELLRRYVFERSEAAFAELVRQHIALVYSAALRQTGGDAHRAEDVAQEVFADLARKAPRLTRHASLSGWLYTSTRYAAATLRRAEQRRCAREHEAHAMNELLQTAETDPAWGHYWEQVRPVLDEAMHDLKEADREAVLLRFFEHLPLAAVGERIGVTENTARMRVDRALDKLREALARRGVTSTAGALSVVLTGQAVGAVPAGLAGSVSGAAMAAAGAASVVSVLLARLLISTKLKLLAGAAAAIAFGVPLIWHHELSTRPSAATVSEPVVTAAAVSRAQADAPVGDTAAPSAGQAMPTDAATLRLTILAADAKKPVAAVEVECTATKDKQKTQEKFLSRRDGICDVHYPKDSDALELISRTDGFADTILHWEPAKGDTVPTNYTLRLIRAVRIGGYVRDEDGSPVPGAKVEFRRDMRVEDPAMVVAHENHEFKYIETVTDAKGRWSLDRIAPDMLGRTVGLVRHPDYVLSFVINWGGFRSGEEQRLVREAAFVSKLRRATMVRGTVVDPQGNPISGARVVVGERGREGEFEEATTLTDGSFRAKRGQPGATRISVTAKGFVAQVMKLDREDDALKVILEPGRTLQLKVVDQAGRPVPQAKIAVELPGTINAPLATTDAGGRAILQEAPATGGLALWIEAAACKQTRVTLSADGEEHSVTLVRAAAVSGTVTDAVTGQPIPAFRVISGTPQIIAPPSTNVSFAPSPSSEHWYKFAGGKFRLGMDQLFQYNSGTEMSRSMLKFEADGYAPSVSRVIQTDGPEVQLQVALMPAPTINVTVLNPNGRPATDAEIGPVRPGIGIQVTRECHLSIMRNTGLLRPDSQGVFALPPDDSIERVIAINSHGFAEASPSALSRARTLQLQPFGRLEGRWLARNQPTPGRTLVLSVADMEAAGYTLDCSATTDGEGRFTFAQVPAGKYQLTWSGHVANVAGVEVRQGETSTITVGTCVVSLRLRWPADLAPGKRTRIVAVMNTPTPEPPATIMQDAQAFSQWVLSPKVRDKYYRFVEGADGSWTSEDVLAGTAYTLEAWAGDEPAIKGSPALIVYGRMSVTVPAESASGIIDAGELVLQRVKSAPVRVTVGPQ